MGREYAFSRDVLTLLGSCSKTPSLLLEAQVGENVNTRDQVVLYGDTHRHKASVDQISGRKLEADYDGSKTVNGWNKRESSIQPNRTNS